MKLLVFLAKGFETIEFSAFIDVMGWAKTDFDCKIDVVTCGLNQKVISSFNVPVLVDKSWMKCLQMNMTRLRYPADLKNSDSMRRHIMNNFWN